MWDGLKPHSTIISTTRLPSQLANRPIRSRTNHTSSIIPSKSINPISQSELQNRSSEEAPSLKSPAIGNLYEKYPAELAIWCDDEHGFCGCTGRIIIRWRSSELERDLLASQTAMGMANSSGPKSPRLRQSLSTSPSAPLVPSSALGARSSKCEGRSPDDRCVVDAEHDARPRLGRIWVAAARDGAAMEASSGRAAATTRKAAGRPDLPTAWTAESGSVEVARRRMVAGGGCRWEPCAVQQSSG
ncbi:hypothetical protein C2845_PM11G20740 [Panicum miliaceum]|uniref:Uncharacterized protein n=1 Tax=Panicum miliaceum TaxID=4540 RepID=A0A3L6RPS1_PANMI|nr:hypothetical protein C2845_PM11G20740 [Panicum miliaceum]